MAESIMIGRDLEKKRLDDNLRGAMAGKGCTIIIDGQPGIGKSTLVNWLCNEATKSDIRILKGCASLNKGPPFLVFSSALADLTNKPVFEEKEQISFSQLLAISPAGMLIAKASVREEDVDADIFAGMLTAVQNFVRDSFDSSGTGNAGLGRLEYGTMKIMIEHGQHIFLVAVLKNQEHPDMARDLKRTLADIESASGTVLEKWSGNMNEVRPIADALANLIERRFAVKKDLTGVKLEAEMVKIASGILDSIRITASKTPVILVLEDLHWADESSLFVIRFLARNLHDMRLMVVGTSRDTEGTEWKKNLALMRDEGIVNEIHLEGLDPQGVANMVNTLCHPNDLPPSFAQRLYSDCAGNPFFVTELLRQMQHEGALELSQGIFTLTQADYRIPASVEDVVVKRLETLEPDSMAMAEYLSCIGRDSEISIANSVRMVKEPAQALTKLSDAGIISLTGTKAEFTHAIFHGTIYGGISQRWLETHHRSIGEHYEKIYAQDLQSVYYELVRHFSRARPDAKAFDYCARAGEKAEGSFAMEQAIDFYRKALDVLPKAHLGESHRLRGTELRERMGDILMLTGSYDESIAAYMSVVSETESAEIKARMHRKSSDGFLKRGDYDGCLAEVAKGMEFAADSIEKWRLLHQESYIMLRKGDFEGSIAKTMDIISHLQNNPEYRKDVAQSHETLGSCFYLKGEFDQALEQYHIASEIYGQIGFFRAVGTAHNNIGNVLGNRAKQGPALENYNKALAIMEKLGDKHGISVVLMNIAAVHQSNGELDKALEINQRSLRMGEMLGDQRIISAILGNIGGIYQLMGKPIKGLETLQKCLAIKQKIDDKQGMVWVTGNIGVILNYLGKTDEARAILLETVANAEKMGAKWDLMGDYFTLGDLNKDTDNTALAEEYYLKAMDLAEKLEVPDYMIDSMRGLIEVLLTTGRLAEALTMSADAGPHAPARHCPNIPRHGPRCERRHRRSREGIFRVREDLQRDFKQIRAGKMPLRMGKNTHGCRT